MSVSLQTQRWGSLPYQLSNRLHPTQPRQSLIIHSKNKMIGWQPLSMSSLAQKTENRAVCHIISLNRRKLNDPTTKWFKICSYSVRRSRKYFNWATSSFGNIQSVAHPVIVTQLENRSFWRYPQAWHSSWNLVENSAQKMRCIQNKYQIKLLFIWFCYVFNKTGLSIIHFV